MSTILGIDPGYGRCGFGVIREEGREWRHVASGVITTAKEEAFADRLAEIAHDLREIISAHHPNVLAIEELFFSKSTTTALKVAEVRGVICMIAKESGAEVIEVKPNEVKLAVTGYGRADKHQVGEMVKAVFHLQEVPKPDDAADALAIAWCGTMKILNKTYGNEQREEKRVQ